MDDSDADLEETLAALTEVLEEITTQLEAQNQPTSSRPTVTDDVLRLADEVAIPILIGLLKANVHALELLRRGIRRSRSSPPPRGSRHEIGGSVPDNFTSIRRSVLGHLDQTLEEIQGLSSGHDHGSDSMDELLREARSLREDVESHLSNIEHESALPTDADSDGTTIDIIDEERESTAIDIDAELDTLREQYGEAEDTPSDERSDDAPDSDADGSDQSSPSDDDNDDE